MSVNEQDLAYILGEPYPDSARKRKAANDILSDLREAIEQELELGGDASTLVPTVTEWLRRIGPEISPPPTEEVEWEYYCQGDGYNRYVYTEADAKKWSDRGYTVSKRTKPVEAGPWIKVQL